MADTTFVDQTTKIVAVWLNDVNVATYRAAANITGAVGTRKQIEKNADTLHIKDGGAVCDGVIDDTSAINTFLAANPGRTIRVTGTPLISSSIFLDGQQRLVGEGGVNAGTSAKPGTYFKKKSTMTTVGVVIGVGSILQGIGVYCPSGSTGGGIQLRGNSAEADTVTIVGDGPLVAGTGVGARVGDTPGTNTNSWRMRRVIVSGMSGDAFWVHDGKAAAPDCNSGKGDQCQALSNGGKGLVIDNATLNTFDTFLEEGNIGWGVDVGSGSGITSCVGNTVLLGDTEANTAGQIRFGVYSNQNILHASPFASVTDLGFFTKRFDRYNGGYKAFTPGWYTSGGTIQTLTAVAISGTIATWTCVGHGYINGQTVTIGVTSGHPNVNLNGCFVISNVTANTFDVTIRSDRTFTVPTSGSGLSVSCQVNGTAAISQGKYRLDGSDIVWSITLQMSSLINMSGNLALVLPWPGATLGGGNLNAAATIAYYSGVTHTGILGLPIAHDGRVQFTLYNNIGSTLTPTPLQASGLAANAFIIMSGRYTFFDEG